jgi:hypothetical protein
VATGRKRNGSKARLRKHFLENIGRVMTSEELQAVSGGKAEFGRRIRELRGEEGYRILTHNDRNSLSPGEYLLEDPTPVPAFARTISKETRALVLERNGYVCQHCGAAASEPHPYDPTRKTRLQIGHIIDKSKGGTDDLHNLRAICSVCNEGLQNIAPMRPDLRQLTITVRRATAQDQLEILKWLKRKFPDH